MPQKESPSINPMQEDREYAYGAEESECKSNQNDTASPLHSSKNTKTFKNDQVIDKPSCHDDHEKARSEAAEEILKTLPEGIPLHDLMWTWNYIGLYSQYAAVGLLYGMSGILLNFCTYHYDGEPNLCANSTNFVFLAWNFKLFFAIATDSYRPFGKRRVAYMIAGWSLVLIILLVLACTASDLSASRWIGMLMTMQAFVMLSDVPADGYSVELGQLESIEQRGQILATGQRIRFTFSMLAGAIQAFLTNGTSTNAPGCEISFNECWGWGFTISEYYGFMFCITFVLCIPVFFLKELDPSKFPQHTPSEFKQQLWETVQNLTTKNIMVYVVGINIFAPFYNNAAILLQYYVIELTNFESGIDTITTYLAIVAGIHLFQTYLINKNWRYSKYGSVVFSSVLGLMWPLAYYNVGGLRDPWFTIFVDLDQNFASGITQVLYSMAVIELAKKGLEATTYELLISVGNSALTVGSLLSTQMLMGTKATGCQNEDPDTCGSNTVALASVQSYEDSDGPSRFANYTFLIIGIQILGTLVFTPFLPRSKEECHEWRELGIKAGSSATRGKVVIAGATFIITYGITAAILLLNDSTSCEQAVGGTGC